MADKTILIVEDEEDLVQTLEYNLRQEGYTTRVALTGKRLRQKLGPAGANIETLSGVGCRMSDAPDDRQAP